MTFALSHKCPNWECYHTAARRENPTDAEGEFISSATGACATTLEAVYQPATSSKAPPADSHLGKVLSNAEFRGAICANALCDANRNNPYFETTGRA